MESVINDVELLDLAVIPTDGGPVMHMMRPASPLFGEIGEVYFSEVEPGCVKAWKCHTRQTQRFAVPVGRLKIVLYDDRPESPTRGRIMEVLLGGRTTTRCCKSRRVSGTALRRRGAFLRLSATARTSRTIRRKGSVGTSIRGISPIIGNTSGQGFPALFLASATRRRPMRPPDGGAGGEPPETDMSMRLSRSIVGEAEAEAVHRRHLRRRLLGHRQGSAQFEAVWRPIWACPRAGSFPSIPGQPPCIWLSRPCSGTGAARKCWCLR